MNGKRLLPLCGLICATAMLGACVGQSSSSSAANESMYLEQRVQEHDTLLRQMQPAQAEVWNQVQAMRQELNTLKGLATVVIYAKMCRGEMTRFILKNRIEDIESLKSFEWEGFTFDEALSQDNRLIFTLK